MGKIICGDFREIMPTLADNSFDMVITSPPYNMNLRIRNGQYCSRQIVKEMSTKYDGYDDNLPMDEYADMLRVLFRECIRVAGLSFINIQCVTGNKPALWSLVGEFSENIKDVIVWDKVNAQPAMQFGVMNSRFEFIFIMAKDGMSRRFPAFWDRGKLDNLWQIKRARAVKGHGATFPDELVARIIENFMPEGGSLLDPMCGTGTSCAVAKKMGHYYLGIELLEHYAELARKRCNEILI
jgi:site-specific DNA-methyltransferase (adenine-specific)/modification methylase